jgi:glycosyltransferase involved in cell wall biosynthesis
MASGRPIIAHDIPAIREILSNEVNALLIKPGESDELIFAINRLIQDKHLAYRLAEKARIDVEKYTWQERARKLLEYLHKNNQ